MSFKCVNCKRLVKQLRKGKCLKCYRKETGLSELRKQDKCSHIKELKKLEEGTKLK